MTRMLTSVASLREAEIAFAGGADIIELNGSTPGALRALSLDVIRTAVGWVSRPCSVSAVCGDLSMRPSLVTEAVCEIAATGVDYVKVEIGPGNEAAACIRELATIAKRVKLIAVFFADASPDMSLLPLLKRSHFAGAMLDTRARTGGRLLDYFDVSRLLHFVEDCHDSGMISGLAGSLETPDIPRLLVLAPDLLGFRGALCDLSEPSATLDLTHVRAVRGMIPLETNNADVPRVDFHLTASDDNQPADLVFVEDLVLPVFIGAYAREYDKPQNVRFGVTASVMRAESMVEDIHDVFSYDLITDGIRMLIGLGHFPLVETLAERIAAMVLKHPRVTKAVVRVQKLETGSGTVGVQIERTRATARTYDRA